MVTRRRRRSTARGRPPRPVLDPEVPVLTIADLGILRDVDGRRRRQRRRHHHADLLRLPGHGRDPRRRRAARCARAGFADVEVRTVLSPGLDHRLDDRRGPADAAEYGIAPPQPAHAAGGPGAACRCRCAARSAASPDTRELSPVRLDRVQVAVALPRLPRAVRPLQGASDVTDHATRSASTPRARRLPPAAGRGGRAADRRRGRGHLRRCPTELRGRLRASTPGQHLTVRTAIDGDEVRRTYSICAAGRRAAGCGSASSGCPAACSPATPLDALRGRRRARRDDADRALHAALDPASAKHYCAIAAGSGITPVLSIVATVLERRAGQHGHPGLRQPHDAASVMFLEELADLKDRYPDRFQLRARAVPRAAGRRAAVSGRLDADAAAPRCSTTLVARGQRRRVVPVRAVRDGRGGPRGAARRAGVDRRHVHVELFHVEGEAPREPAPADGRAAATRHRR